MKQVLAVRVGAKKAVGHIVSKKWCLTWRLFFGIGFDTVIHLCYSTQCSCAKIVHLDIETRVAEPH